VLVRTKLWAQVILGMLLGILVGGFLRTDWHPFTLLQLDVIAEWIAIPGVIFLRTISMIMIPLVVASILRGFGGRSDNARIKKIGFRLMVYILLTTLTAVAIGIFLSELIGPGTFVDSAAHSVTQLSDVVIPVMDNFHMPTLVSNFIPNNPFDSILRVDMLGIVVFSVFIGLSIASLPKKKVSTLLDLLGAIMDISLTIVKWAMFLAPLAVFGFIAQMIIKMGMSTLLSLSVYIMTVILGLMIMYFIYLAIYYLWTKTSPLEFARKIISPQLLAFSTSSSTATMPLSIKTAEDELGVETGTAELIIPIGATMNMAGTALYQTVTLFLLAQMGGVDLSLVQMGILIFSVVASSIGAPGTPGLAMVILTTIAVQSGIPTAGIAMVVGVDRILDMFRTSINVTGDLTACAIFNERASEKQTIVERLVG
jgi:Na+/H+-dicarboxylate symporter